MNTTTATETVLAHLDATRGERMPNRGTTLQPTIVTSRRGLTTEQLRAAVKTVGARMEQASRTSTRYEGVKIHWLVYCPGWAAGVSGR